MPCPFCGEEASGDAKVTYGEKYAKEQGWSQNTFYYCNCPVCGVNNQGLRGYDTKTQAVAAWNRRAVDAATLQVRSSEAASQSSPSSARERREIIEECAGALQGTYDLYEAYAGQTHRSEEERNRMLGHRATVWECQRLIRSLSSDGRGREGK